MRKFHEPGFAKLDSDLIEHPAFWALSSANAVRVLVRLLQKRRFSKRRRRKSRPTPPELINQGRIEFTWGEAQQLGIGSRGTLLRIIAELMALGFLDIEEEDQGPFRPGYGRSPTRYRISGRWRAWGTPQFKPREKPRVLPPGLGFKVGNEEWIKSKSGK